MQWNDLYTAYVELSRLHSGRVLFRNEGVTFGETWEQVQARAHFLKHQGLGRGDVVALLATNSPQWCMSFMAITAIGAIALPLDTNLPAEQYRDMAKCVDARAAFVSNGFQGVFTDIPVFGLEDTYAAHGPLASPGLDGDATASLLFTSGTTGNPKIVALSHGNILHVALTCTELEQFTHNDIVLAMLPLYHVYAFESTFMAPLVTGGSLVFQASLKGPDIIRTLGENDITIFPAAPLMWELFLDGLLAKIRAQSALKYRIFLFFLKTTPFFQSLGLGFLPRKIFEPVHDVFGRHIRFFISGGAALKPDYFHYYSRMGFHIMEGYGLTETTGPIAIPYYKEAAAGAVGPPISGNEVRIKNTNADGIGEIWLKGPAVMLGYFRNDEANRQAFDDDGFFNTQDLGFVDGRGHIHVTGRIKNVIVLDSGKNIYPEELELYFGSAPQIAEIAVISRRVEGREVLYAVIVPTRKGPDSYSEIREVLAGLNKGLPVYKTISNFALSADPLPRNSTRKILVDEVKRLLEQGVYQLDCAGRAIPLKPLSAENSREETIIAVLKQRLHAKDLCANETLSNHNIDSLGLIDLIVSLEEALSIAIDETRINPLMTLEEFVRYLGECPEHSSAHLDEIILRGPITTKRRVFPNPLVETGLFLLRGLSRLFWGLKIHHREHLNVDNAIIALNHQSMLDLPWLLCVLPYAERQRLFVTGKKELAFLRYFLPGIPVVFVDRGGNVVPALKAAADVLRNGDSLIIFPEGTRSRDGQIGAFKSGAAYLAYHLNKQIIPVAVNGAFKIMPPGDLLPRFFCGVRGRLSIGKAIDPAAFDSVDALNEHLHNTIAKLGSEAA